MNKKILFLVLLGVLVLPAMALAQNITITGMVQNVAKVVWTVGTIIVIILWVITGVLFLAAQGDPGKLKTAKTALFTSIAGTVIIILAFSVAGIIENAIFRGA
ncbi:MAG: hypothetical protein A2998_01460 [Candidatus Staskawiczbacteria bacterium RIFCSPLOWO2_01_FULL_37_25b]|uniref:Uncharacterized protein n=1 Tax=Candidatus Staskawiczbacteria bacterium RIFCSPLOWO2_01_FULL_37_25b TaxID=1802213 RepID=A0A1G2ICZ0_9BACT|nr:MAG: hypothetical protein A2998_01455 [Candidatus Staskawiczbacteria bacterium RIFCSPLOWO2_01_FULL_37_25b]OGZ72613.1 MAG: hypothetical protein A2998_01460 [Candidatus Staskawiczbacteria bacterium RIFCSPLOWO2_01_FULL_37_25b]